ncbi:MAG: nuclease domain-containing protein, partial [Agathobacter sp.]|nr:nuclease domain-containing protein [Agathobacter sp.]
ELENMPNNIVAKIPNTHELTAHCVYIYYKGITKKFEEREEKLRNLYYKYQKNLQCIPDIIYNIPRMSNTFKSNYRYRLCYECMIRWFHEGDYSFDNINHLFKLKTLSRIFEYYCLIKLQVAITQCGYVLQEVNKIIYDEDDIEDINNRYLFEGRGYKVTLLYEPYIWDNRIYDDIKLYSTRYNFIKHKWGDKWKPDFVIKVSSINQDYYYILDAKYSNLKNVERRYLPELVLKYGTQIASKDRFFSEIIGVGAIYPGEKHHIKYFKSNKINSSKVSLPQYFAMTLLNGENGNQAMISDIKELFKIIDEIELEFELEPTSTLNKKENIDYSLFNQDAEDGEQSNLDPIQNSVRVTGKRCFYFAKGVCLRHKKRCNIVNSPCEFYLSQNEGKLRTEKCDCRHLLQNKSRKRYTIHCDISEKNGCIGKDKCGFYVKVKR